MNLFISYLYFDFADGDFDTLSIPALEQKYEGIDRYFTDDYFYLLPAYVSPSILGTILVESEFPAVIYFYKLGYFFI